ncbi:hypothetical protein D3C71_1628910 [compost metagenome]
MPPTAAMIGRASFLGLLSSPLRISYLISSPTTRKKTAIRPSLIQLEVVSSSRSGPTWSTWTLFSQAK